ncbi:hypothetical protein EAI_00987 [Harpegnathos saltator]|uniref:DUF4806 domain-containing protein n=1 Tax=Harpegnathos saltator TaxID=610380 RepID=E2BQE1_HARSA|nr:hypothetical protein EAI_00987 [Harpegnathos saltator]
MHTDIESGVEDEATRAKRKKKRFEEESDEDIDDDTDEELENKPRKQSKKGGDGSNTKTLKMQPPQLPIFNDLPANRDNILSSNEDDILDRTYDTQDDVSCLSESSSKREENTRTPVDRSPESATQEEEQIVDDLSQEEETDKADENITGVTALWKKMYEKIAKIEKRQANMASNVEEIKQLILSKAETLTHPKDLPKLPLQTYADSIHLEEKIYRAEAKKDYVIKRLCLATRGASDKECAKQVMEKLMSNHVGTFYSWQESGGKKDAFKNSIMMEIVRHMDRWDGMGTDEKEIAEGVQVGMPGSEEKKQEGKSDGGNGGRSKGGKRDEERGRGGGGRNNS